MIKKYFLLLFISLQPLILAENNNLKVYFDNECEDIVIDEIAKAKKRIRVAIFTFTRFSIAKAMIKAKARKVDIQIIVDKKQAESEYGQKILNLLRKHNIEITLFPTAERVHMHHKFLIVDSRSVITGSYNFTTAASKHNSENIISFNDANIAQHYVKEWNKLKLKALHSKKEKRSQN
ncbi:MAG: phospholipase D-like domain-containing protein [Lentisphaeraceae bacterium]|nr:phospholipase D-like domain-containing protein [Lentisphaeraceae bacterium]